MTTAFYTHPDCRGHDMGAGHPECPARLDAIEDHLIATGLQSALDRREAPVVAIGRPGAAPTAAATSPSCATCSSASPPAAEPRAIDPDTVAAPGTWNAALRAAGAAVAATDAVIDGEVANAFCAVRPPGHHATREPGDGLLLLQQRRRRRAPRARRARPRARRHHRLRRPSRQRHRGHHRRRRAHPDGEHLPAPALSVFRRGADGRQHDQRAGAALHARPGDPRADRGELARSPRPLRGRR